MALFDALLLEGYPLDVWFALRNDGAKGSGAEADPYNGNPRLEPALVVTSLTNSGRVATASTAPTNHGYQNDEVVTISGVTGSEAQYYNGAFAIYGVTSTSFNYWMKGDPGASASGTKACARTYYQFDEIMPNVPINTAIHLGPGVF